MKRSSKGAHLITADNPEWTSAELPASHHSVISEMCSQKVLRQHRRSPPLWATCLPLSLWGLLKPFFCTGLGTRNIEQGSHLLRCISVANLRYTQWDSKPICWPFHLLLLGKIITKASIQLHIFWWGACTIPPWSYDFDLMLFLNTAGGKYRL